MDVGLGLRLPELPEQGELPDRIVVPVDPQIGDRPGHRLRNDHPVRSAGMVIAESAPWPVTDLRVDWHDDPVGQLAGLWQLWQPQVETYVRRALRPSS